MLDPGGGFGFGGAGGGIWAFRAGLFGDGGKFLIRVAGGYVFLRVVDTGNILPERVGRSASDAVAVVSSFGSPVVRGQGGILEYQTGVFLLRHQLIDGGLGLLAMGALQIAELNHRHGSIRRAAGRAV